MPRGKSQKSIVSFNAGELSPLLDARVDIEKYSNGCRQLQNAIIETYGAARRRSGTEFIAEAKYHDKPCRLIDFQFSTTTTFTIEVGHQYLRFFSNGAQVLSGGSPYEVSTPYDEADLFEIQYAQINDVAYLVHPDYPVQKLSRIADTNWTLAAVEFLTPALLDENLTDTTITASATSGSVNLTASAAIFQADHIGSYWQLAHLREATSEEVEIIDAVAWLTATAYVKWDTVTQAGTRYVCLEDHTSGTFATDLGAGKWEAVTYYQVTPPMRILGDWELNTYSIWTADIYLERSTDEGVTWERIRKWSGKDDRNVNATGSQDTEAWLRVVVENWVTGTAGTTTPRVTLEAVDAYIYGIVKITGYTDTTHVAATVITDLESTDATKVWREGAWSDVRGYPRTVTIYEQRMCFAGSNYQPQTVWGSVTGDFENFKTGSDDTDSFAYTIGAQERNAIQWMVAQKALLIGTSGGEWSMQAGSQDQPLTPTNVLVRRQSNYGSRALNANLVNDVVLFIQRQGRKVRELTYSFEKDGFVAPDMTLLSEHITDGGIVQTAFQQQPRSILWVVTSDGTLAGMTYERDQNVVGWHRHVTDGTFESVATIYGSADDEIWLVVNRTIGGSTKRYIERINPVQWTDLEDAFYVDSGLSYDGSATDTFSGLSHLEGKTVKILADGAPVPDQVVASGAVTLDDPASVVHIGLAYETIIQPMRLDVDSQAGVSQGQVKQIRELVLRLNNSLGLQYGDGEAFYNLSFRDTSDYMDAAPPLFTGDKVVEFDGDFDLDVPFIVKQSQPLPLCLLAIIVKYAITGN